MGGTNMSKIIGTDALMEHLRIKHKVEINGSTHRQKLRTFGYYHGYKGYRFIRTSTNKVAFTSFDEVIAFNQFDLELKTLFYPSIMFLETALKNYVLEELLKTTIQIKPSQFGPYLNLLVWVNLELLRLV